MIKIYQGTVVTGAPITANSSTTAGKKLLLYHLLNIARLVTSRLFYYFTATQATTTAGPITASPGRHLFYYIVLNQNDILFLTGILLLWKGGSGIWEDPTKWNKRY